MRSKFTAAPVHDDFPEGGLRIVGMLPPNEDDSLGPIASTTGTSTGGFKPSTSAANSSYSNYFPVSPTANSNSVYAAGGFLHGSSANVISTLAQYFRYFRYRRLFLHYEGESPTTTLGTVQFTYDRDMNSSAAQTALVGGNIRQAAISTTVVDRFPWWTPKAEVQLINDMKCSPADKLYALTSAGLTIASTKPNADFELLTQGAISCTTDTAQTASAQTLGRFRWEFVLDLYGFCGYPADNSVAMRKPDPEKPIRTSSDRGDVKSTLPPNGEDTEHEYVDLTPRVMRVRELEPVARSSVLPARVQSLK
jgi:hypothetical protein